MVPAAQEHFDRPGQPRSAWKDHPAQRHFEFGQDAWNDDRHDARPVRRERGPRP